jgi:hypothetical protein
VLREYEYVYVYVYGGGSSLLRGDVVDHMMALRFVEFRRSLQYDSHTHKKDFPYAPNVSKFNPLWTA